MSRFFDELEERLRASTAEQHGRGADEADTAERPPACAPRRRRIRRRPLIAVVLAVGALAVPAVGAVTDVWHPDVKPAPPMHVPRAPRATGVACKGRAQRDVMDRGPLGPEFTSVLSVLARPRTAADVFPRKYLRSSGVGNPDPRNIRRLGTGPDGVDYFVIPSHGPTPPLPSAGCLRKLPSRVRGQWRRHWPATAPVPSLCLFGRGTGGCTSLAAFAAYGTFGASGTRHGRATVSGLVPDGVHEVRVTYGRSTREFPVHDNFFAFEVAVDVRQASSPDRVEWLMDDGSVRDGTRRLPPPRTGAP